MHAYILHTDGPGIKPTILVLSVTCSITATEDQCYPFFSWQIFVTYFSRSLNSEYKSQGITVQNIALSIFFPDWLRLSSYCVKQTEKFATSMEKKIDEMTERSASKED
ncbi:unnamed protein product [Oncorhynchus mykiss]|uniref:Uncharacterized protein n=1 Tax=Oncorhynchus mykiss TaxID=8022 RepID=A0A060XBF0_ONCMY|nr:unnamed protein product [Oncorhynchus mykiss]